MSFRNYDPIQKYGNRQIKPSAALNLLVWAYQNPEKALEIGAKIAAVGIVVWFLGALFKK